MFFRLKRDDISPAITRMIQTARHPRPVLRAMGTTFKSITEGTFNSAGADMRPIPWKPKRDGSPSNLQLSTTMSKSFQLAVTDTTATVSNPMPYAGIHQFGRTIKAKIGPYLKFNWGGGWASVASVTIPARPFFPVLDGKLTPRAEDLIRRAGERMLLKQAGSE